MFVFRNCLTSYNFTIFKYSNLFWLYSNTYEYTKININDIINVNYSNCIKIINMLKSDMNKYNKILIIIIYSYIYI